MLPLDRWAVDLAFDLQQGLLKAYDNYTFHLIYQRVLSFCNEDLGGFYLDIIKDRQYTTQADSLARRSCQSAMYHILEALARWIAPILSFTADEIWSALPAPAHGARSQSVQLETWYDDLFALDPNERFGRAVWARIRVVKDAVNGRIEQERNAGRVKGSLATEVDLYCDGELRAQLESLSEELRFVLLSSYARVHGSDQAGADGAIASELEGLLLKVSATAHGKCERCWHHRETVGQTAQYPDLCDRCVDNVEGAGEQRRYA
jgi:isoleucyl-tRNA synthetase